MNLENETRETREVHKSGHLQIFFKIYVFLKVFRYLQENKRVGWMESFLNKVTGLRVCNFIKKDSGKGIFL